MASYPALDVSDVDVDRVVALIDDYSPTAIEDHGGSLTIYFANQTERDDAERAIARQWPFTLTVPREVDDEDWAERSQAGLTAVTVGRITVSPPWALDAQVTMPQSVTVAISPSMGFGTGHHATTRLCLKALQTLELTGRSVLDVGTGSGVLAIAARLLGARDAVGFDADSDALRSARENLLINPSADRVRFELGDFRTVSMSDADVVTANLTGALLVRSAQRLLSLVSTGGILIVSGLLSDERSLVEEAFVSDLRSGDAAQGSAQPRAAHIVWAEEEDGWVSLAFNLGTSEVV